MASSEENEVEDTEAWAYGQWIDPEDQEKHEEDQVEYEDDMVVISIGSTQFRLDNTTQRCLSSWVLAPSLTVLVWFVPSSVIWVVTTAVFIGVYEFTWLAFRIQSRVRTTYHHYEDMHHCQYAPCVPADQVDQVAQAFVLPAIDTDDCVIASLSTWCCHRRLVALVLVSIPSTAALVGIDVLVHQLRHPEAPMDWIYLVVVRWLTSVCACMCPTGEAAVFMVFSSFFCTEMMKRILACPVGVFTCAASGDVGLLLMVAVGTILFFRCLVSRDPLEVVVHGLLDTFGFLWLVGCGMAVVNLVDLAQPALTRALVLTLLWTVWAADSGAFFCGQLMEYCEYSYYHPLRKHLSANKDVEGTIVAVVCGIGAMIGTTQWVFPRHQRPSIPIQVGMAIACVLAGRMGDLLQSMLKRSAGVKQSGRLLPGHGGLLDRIDSVWVASVVFGLLVQQLIV